MWSKNACVHAHITFSKKRPNQEIEFISLLLSEYNVVYSILNKWHKAH